MEAGEKEMCCRLTRQQSNERVRACCEETVRVPKQNRTNDFELDFVNERRRQSGKEHCERLLSSRCLAGARAGCALSASRRCKPSLFKMLGFSRSNGADDLCTWESREACESTHMASCLLAVGLSCTEYARDTCDAAYTYNAPTLNR
ncbi:hypothetical protein CYMTET_12715 [Cymbomonas tetramitiformis]|uniref:Uncharacterized protein n=1 Tax=Cymbomonas tetramitiformis TaxID=36881 RepID=A0AAE0GJJ7_9CHLO|nr:hypothetical protein CYMTET_12715 [Cymbomonas tetramitiformis]